MGGVLLGLSLITICLFFFLPVQFNIFLKVENWNSTVLLELSFLEGMLHRKKEIRWRTNDQGRIREEVESGFKWFGIKIRTNDKRKAKTQEEPLHLVDVLERYRKFGLGATLLFLPNRYYKWLSVAERLEHRGYFQKFDWATRIGVDDAAGTAVCSGLLWGLKTTISGYFLNRYWFRQTPKLDVVSDFDNAGLNTVFNCIFRVKLGYIIVAAIIANFRHSW